MSQNFVEVSLDNGKTWVKAIQPVSLRWKREDDHILVVGHVDGAGLVVQDDPYANDDRVFSV